MTELTQRQVGRAQGLTPLRVLVCALALASGAPHIAAAQVRVVDVAAGDFFFRAPDSIPAGRTEFRMTNAGGHHVMAIARLDSAKTLANAMAWRGPDNPPWMVDLGGPITGDSNGVVSAMLDLVPGRYMLYCYFWDANSVPHSHDAKGMIKEFFVTGAAPRADTTTTADIVVTVTDYDYVLSRPITAGRHTIRFVNTSTQAHEIIIDRLTNGAHQAEWLEAGRSNVPRPGRSAGGIGGLPAGKAITMTADFPAGDYLWFCVFQAPDRRNHIEHGMVKEIHVE